MAPEALLADPGYGLAGADTLGAMECKWNVSEGN
jgi:hypothetical protein